VTPEPILIYGLRDGDPVRISDVMSGLELSKCSFVDNIPFSKESQNNSKKKV
jgi:hypothetical protein